ncbi:hypothetical protein C8N46_104317 [Kordia periserrulae]|uniref:Uncharacterized protein n=1 Tax=Kordia periserrulae TaxID=701523 RepID=A0A2T6C028_9FLAO|nr:hypothetical protein [Kordia periserrulae]PTX61673.1 hypothetical protein C8N46_104317 [Kordia periserrulae]
MKKRTLSSLKLKKQTISKLDARIHGGAEAASIPTLGIICTIYSYFECEDITHTSKDYDGKHCDIATINDSCLSLCDNICNDF